MKLHTCPYCDEKIYDNILMRKLECSCVSSTSSEDEGDCEHIETVNGTCLDCGEDITEWLAMEAYDRAKNEKYE